MVMDCRGQNGRSEDVGGVSGNTLNGHIIRGLEDGPEKLLFRQVFLDCAQLAGILMSMPEVDETRVGAMGGSQGGGLTLACAALEPRIRRAAPLFPFLGDYRRVWDMDLDQKAYESCASGSAFRPAHKREDEIFPGWATSTYSIWLPASAPRCSCSRAYGRYLPAVHPVRGYNKMLSPKHMITYPDFGHEGLPGAGDRTFEFMMGL
jgi:cephalosporin-C deacetylase